MFKFSLKVMSKEKRKYFSFAITMLILTTVEFIFFELVNHQLITGMPAAERISMSILSLMIITFSFFITFYVNSQYIDYKRKELGLLYLCGRNLLDISKYLFLQYLVIFIIVIPIGFILGAVILPVLYSFIANQYDIGMNIFQYNLTGIVETMIFVLTKIGYIIIVNIGFTYRNEIIEIINRTDKKKNKQMMDIVKYGGGASIKMSFASFGMIGMDPKARQEILAKSINETIEERKLKQESGAGKKPLFITLVSIAAYFVTLVLMIMNDFTSGNFAMYCYVNSFALATIVSFAIPYFIGKAHGSFMNKSPVRFVVLNDLQLMLKDSLVPLVMIVAVLPSVVSIISFSLGENLYRMVALIGYIVLEIILAGCLYFKNIVYIHSRESEFKSLSVMGYNQDLIKKIINREVICHFLIASVLPLISIAVQIYKSYVFGGLSTIIMAIMIISYIAIFMTAFGLTLIAFRNEYTGRKS